MIANCERCKKHASKVGRLQHYNLGNHNARGGLTLSLCRECRIEIMQSLYEEREGRREFI